MAAHDFGADDGDTAHGALGDISANIGLDKFT
jgi:hypothetical protein